MYQVLCRYEYWGKDGITWTDWYVDSYHETEETAQEKMKYLGDFQKKLPSEQKKLKKEIKCEFLEKSDYQKLIDGIRERAKKKSRKKKNNT